MSESVRHYSEEDEKFERGKKSFAERLLNMGILDWIRGTIDRDVDIDDELDGDMPSRGGGMKDRRGDSEIKENIVNVKAKTELQVILLALEQFSDSGVVADHLIERHSVILNLESTKAEVRSRIVDFLAGVCYAIGGQVKQVANNTYILTPINVNIEGDLLDELESSGVFF